MNNCIRNGNLKQSITKKEAFKFYKFLRTHILMYLKSSLALGQYFASGITTFRGGAKTRVIPDSEFSEPLQKFYCLV